MYSLCPPTSNDPSKTSRAAFGERTLGFFDRDDCWLEEPPPLHAVTPIAAADTTLATSIHPSLPEFTSATSFGESDAPGVPSSALVLCVTCSEPTRWKS